MACFSTRPLPGNQRAPCATHSSFRPLSSALDQQLHAIHHVMRADPTDGDGSRESQSPSPTYSLDTAPTDIITWGGRLPSRRRLLSSLTTATAVALGGNLGGCTSALLALDDGAFAEHTGLDRIVPVGGWKRCFIDPPDAVSFKYPSTWLADQTLARRQAERRARSLDPPSVAAARRAAARPRWLNPGDATEPLAAFGPAASTGEKNISIVAAPIMAGFDVESVDPDKLLEETIGPVTRRRAGADGDASGSGSVGVEEGRAPPPPSFSSSATWTSSSGGRLGGGRRVELLDEGRFVDENGAKYLWFEFTVRKEGEYGFYRHNVTCIAVRNDVLYTVNAQNAADKWAEEQGDRLKEAALSLRLR